MIKISQREKWLVSAAGATLFVFVLMQYYVLPYWDSLGGTSEKIDLESKRVMKYRRVLRGEDSVQASLGVAYKQIGLIETGLLSSKTDALANAEIQGLVKDLATSKGMTFRRSDLLPVKIVSPEYSQVSTRVELVGSMDQLVDFLVSLDSRPKILFAEEMRISPVAAGNPKNKQVMATLMVSALKAADKSTQPGNES